MSGMESQSRPPEPSWGHGGTGSCERVSKRAQRDIVEADAMGQPSGAFTEHCSPCYIIKRGEHNQKVARLLCNCGPDDSDISSEYMLDLGTSGSLFYRRLDYMHLVLG